jgi:hemoglobin
MPARCCLRWAVSYDGGGLAKGSNVTMYYDGTEVGASVLQRPSPEFSHGFHPEHSQRLAAYWGESLGGPTTFTDRYGDETSVVRMHSGNGVHEEMDQRAIVCFDQALADVVLADNRVGQVLHDYFVWATTTVMSRYHRSADDVPEGLRIPRWSWDGLVSE